RIFMYPPTVSLATRRRRITFKSTALLALILRYGRGLGPSRYNRIDMNWGDMRIVRFLRMSAHLQMMPVLESGEETLVGGQAVMEGVMMRAPHSYCVA